MANETAKTMGEIPSTLVTLSGLDESGQFHQLCFIQADHDGRDYECKFPTELPPGWFPTSVRIQRFLMSVMTVLAVAPTYAAPDAGPKPETPLSIIERAYEVLGRPIYRVPPLAIEHEVFYEEDRSTTILKLLKQLADMAEENVLLRAELAQANQVICQLTPETSAGGQSVNKPADNPFARRHDGRAPDRREL